MKRTNVILSFVKIIAIKTKGCIVQVFDAARTLADCNKCIVFVRDMTDHIHRSINNSFQVNNKLFPVKVAELVTDKAVLDSPDIERMQFLKITYKKGAIVQDIKIRSC